MGACDVAELLRLPQACEGHEVLDVLLVGPPRIGIGEVGKPFDLGRHLRQCLELGRGKGARQQRGRGKRGRHRRSLSASTWANRAGSRMWMSSNVATGKCRRFPLTRNAARASRAHSRKRLSASSGATVRGLVGEPAGPCGLGPPARHRCCGPRNEIPGDGGPPCTQPGWTETRTGARDVLRRVPPAQPGCCPASGRRRRARWCRRPPARSGRIRTVFSTHGGDLRFDVFQRQAGRPTAAGLLVQRGQGFWRGGDGL